MTDTAALEGLRPCGRLESYSTSRHHLGYYNNVCLAATYHTPSSAHSLEKLIYSALKQVIDKHTVLSAIPINEDKSHPDVHFARLPSIDLRRCVEFQERKEKLPNDGEADEEMDQLLEEHHNRNFKDDLGSKPFWRLVILRSATDTSTFTATWVVHHALADGASALLFHETLHAALNAMRPDYSSPLVKSPTKLLPPPFEEQHPMTISWPFFLNAVAKSILPSYLDKRPANLWTGNSIPNEIVSAPRFHARTMVLSSATTRRLASLSRKQGVSVTATLQALLAANLFLHLPSSECQTLQIDGPISMRPFLENVPDDQMTNAISTYKFTHQRPSVSNVSEDDELTVLSYFSWSEASAVKSAIQSAVAKKGSDNPVALLKHVSNIHEFVTSDLGKPRKVTAELSNIGMFRPKSAEGQWKVGRMMLSQCANPTSAAFHVNVVTGGDGNASLTVNWCEGAVDEKLLVKLMGSLEESVQALVESFHDEDR